LSWSSQAKTYVGRLVKRFDGVDAVRRSVVAEAMVGPCWATLVLMY
jgi:hypothetical protein